MPAYVCICVRGRACGLNYPACNAPPYCHLRRLWLHHVFRHYLINSTIFVKTLLNIKCVFWFVFSVHPSFTYKTMKYDVSRYEIVSAFFQQTDSCVFFFPSLYLVGLCVTCRCWCTFSIKRGKRGLEYDKEHFLRQIAWHQNIVFI